MPGHDSYQGTAAGEWTVSIGISRHSRVSQDIVGMLERDEGHPSLGILFQVGDQVAQVHVGQRLQLVICMI